MGALQNLSVDETDDLAKTFSGGSVTDVDSSTT